MILVDTNILLDILEDDPVWYEWSLQQLQAQSLIHDLAVNPIIYSELSLAFHTVEEQDRALQSMDLKYQELPRPALFLAGLAFVQYRRSGGQKNNVLPDFFIGAHAAVQGWSILTRDPRRYRNYFPSVRLITPEAPPPKAPSADPPSRSSLLGLPSSAPPSRPPSRLPLDYCHLGHCPLVCPCPRRILPDPFRDLPVPSSRPHRDQSPLTTLNKNAYQ